MGELMGWRSVGVLFADALDLVETEPVIGLGHLAQADDEFVGLLHDLADLGEDQALRLGHCEDPVLSLVVVDADLERSVQEARCDLVGRHLADLLQR
jgi:hypothetical protein